MELTTNERKLLTSDDETLILTSHRIRQEIDGSGTLHIKSITLKQVTSCEYIKESSPNLLILGVLAIVLAIVINSEPNISIISSIVGVALILFYLLSIKRRLIVASPSSKISAKTKGMSKANIKDFINKLEAAVIALEN